VLKLSNGLRSLSLDDNSIKSSGAEELAKSLQVNTNLHTLHLRFKFSKVLSIVPLYSNRHSQSTLYSASVW